jgi:hypothetical protein
MLGPMQKLVIAFVSLIVGIVLITQVASEGSKVTSLSTITETFNLAPARLAAGAINETYYFYPTYLANSGWRADDVADCSVFPLVVKNATGATLDNNGCASAGEYTYVTDVRLNFCNTLSVNNSASNSTTVTYRYCPDGYLTSSWQRTITNLVPGFIALALMAVAVGLFYSIAKETGLM